MRQKGFRLITLSDHDGYIADGYEKEIEEMQAEGWKVIQVYKDGRDTIVAMVLIA